MTLNELINDTRRKTGDKTGSIFTTSDITYCINEAIDRVRFSEYFADMVSLTTVEQSPILLPDQYHHLLSTYATARCFEQDERHYQSVQRMNEFEFKLDALIAKVEEGTIVISDEDGNTVESTYETDFVENVYYNSRDDYDGEETDDDNGLEGI